MNYDMSVFTRPNSRHRSAQIDTPVVLSVQKPRGGGGGGGGGDFNDLYPDVCVEGLEKDPF